MRVPAPPRGTRPRNRRQLIVAAAADLFAEWGYPHVGMSDVADAVGVRPSALYRHVPGKEALLYEVVHEVLTAISAAVGDEKPVRAMASAVLAHRTLGVLWQRESRHLDAQLRGRLRAELVTAVRRFGEHIRRSRPHLDAPAVDLLSWAVAGALMSVSFQRVQLPGSEYEDLLTAIGEGVITTELPGGAENQRRADPARPAPRFRREELLTAATRLFAERGFASVGIDDIGAAGGIAGPSIYHHFTSKVDLLAEVMMRGSDELQHRLAQAQAETSTAVAALDRLLRSYVDYSFAHDDIVDLLITEAAHLPERERRTIRRAQHDYVAAWVGLLEKTEPGLPSVHARVRVQAALSVVNDIARTPHLRRQPGIEHAVGAIGQSILVGDRRKPAAIVPGPRLHRGR